MVTLHVSGRKAQFFKVLAAVRAGERIDILYGQSQEPVAMIVPYDSPDPLAREIGFLNGKVRIEFTDDFDTTEEELLDLGKRKISLAPTPHRGQSDNRTDARPPLEHLF